jgi:hypothetical protein
MRDNNKKIEKSNGLYTGELTLVSLTVLCGPISEHEEQNQSGRGRRWPTAGTGRRGDTSLDLY